MATKCPDGTCEDGWTCATFRDQKGLVCVPPNPISMSKDCAAINDAHYMHCDKNYDVERHFVAAPPTMSQTSNGCYLTCKKKDSDTYIYIIVGAVAVVVLLLFLFMIFRKK